jgi:hypothetical protein
LVLGLTETHEHYGIVSTQRCSTPYRSHYYTLL